ncbi:diguanylate cyclase (GGDEF)-like protein [Pseudomonas sp. GGS8]|uniref:sensor domain-containing diguanylate cyclase n=1 Tax=Pseudomonas sp. GGS8 TaxID=2817892 RepID=UPI00209FB31B|nr:sensor domain-containing diguanylate cyclase [Pseudomonas sp. GGS8]MCP1446026.1 diguanylate cyclase (GGDEF)-like protein [Pseudomonas sp. GGS8]
MTGSIRRLFERLNKHIHSFGMFFCLLMSVVIAGGLWLPDSSGYLRGLSGFALIVQALVLCLLHFSLRLRQIYSKRHLEELTERKSNIKALNARLRNLINAVAQVAVVTTDSLGRTLLFSDGAEKMFGFSREEMLGLDHIDILYAQGKIVGGGLAPGNPIHLPLTDTQLLHSLSKYDGSSLSVERTYRRKDGSHFIGELRRAEIIDADSGQVEHINVIIDVSERIALLNKISEGNAFLKRLTQRIPNVLYQYHLREEGESYFSYCSPSLEHVFELKPEEVLNIGFNQNPVFRRVHEEDLALIHAATMKSAETGEPWACDFRVNLPKKGTRWLRGESYAERQVDETLVWYGSFTDITELKGRETALRVQAITDELTGIYNRRYFMASLQQQVDLAHRYGSSFSLIVLDLDHFKSINDRWGHEGGDRVLKETCRLIGQRLRSSDVFCRIGGEEFAILCPSTQTEQAASLAESLRQSVASHVIASIGPVTASFGVACWQKRLDGQALLRLADEATYSAKQAGRNRVHVDFQ